MIRETSIECFNQIKSEGLVGKLELLVLEVIVFSGPITQGECWNEHFKNRQRHDIGPRFASLEKKGVIKCVGERPCRLTGRTARIYQDTSSLPVKFEKTRRIDCSHCHGKGYIEETQSKWEL